VRLLGEHRLRAQESARQTGRKLGGDDYLFAWFDGEPIRPDSLSQAFRRSAAACGFEGVRFHDTRHTHASLMLKAGVHPKVVSERLGHSSIAFTLDTYSHVLPGIQEAAAASFESVLLGQDPGSVVGTPQPNGLAAAGA
jgi:integrase